MITKALTLTRLASIIAAAAITLAATSCGSESASGSTETTASAETSPATTAPLAPSLTTAPAPQTTSTAPPATPAPSTTEHTQTTPPARTPASTEITISATVPATVAAPPRPTGTVDELVSVGSARMHVRCTGNGQATVLLIAGLTGDHTDFSAIEPRVTEMSRVCSYDRFGTGTSDPPPTPQTFTTQARDLRDALEALGEPGPFVLVGHSFGGPIAGTFTSLHPSDVGGVLLLDASPLTWNAAACAVADDGSAGADLWVQTCAMQANNVEGLDGPAAFAELATIRSLGDVPLIVATADHDYTADDFDPAAAARLTEAWFDGQEHWASLSPNSRLISVDNSGHYIQNDQPNLVIEQITHLLHNLPEA